MLGGTGNPLNEDLLWPDGAITPLGAGERGFPGYGSQMDQMLYRDIDLTGYTNSALTRAHVKRCVNDLRRRPSDLTS
jgi:hypothetical protein